MKYFDVTVTYKADSGAKASSFLTFEGETQSAALQEAKDFFAKELPNLKIIGVEIKPAQNR